MPIEESVDNARAILSEAAAWLPTLSLIPMSETIPNCCRMRLPIDSTIAAKPTTRNAMLAWRRSLACRFSTRTRC